MFHKIFTVVVFVAVYSYLATARRYRARAVWLGALVLALGGVYCLKSEPGFAAAALETIRTVLMAVNWPVIAILSGMMLIAETFTSSRVPSWLSDVLVERSGTVGWALLLVCALASIISAFVDNVATVLIVAPLVFELARRLKISPVAPIIGVAISSNLQGMATLTGDPPSVLLAMHLKPPMTFNDFFVYHGKPGMFFVVQMAAVFSLAVLYLGFFRTLRQKPARITRPKVTTWTPTITLFALIGSLAVMSLGPAEYQHPGVMCLAFAAGLLAVTRMRSRAAARDALRNYDWRLVLLLMGVFVVVKSLDQVGLTDDIADAISSSTGGSLMGTYVLIIAVSVLLSGFIDNIPYITLMLPVTTRLSESLGLENGILLAYGLLIGSCLGGNLTPLGASANIVSVGLLRKHDRHVTFWDFAKMGVPFTLAATIPAAIIVWFIWR